MVPHFNLIISTLGSDKETSSPSQALAWHLQLDCGVLLLEHHEFLRT